MQSLYQHSRRIIVGTAGDVWFDHQPWEWDDYNVAEDVGKLPSLKYGESRGNYTSITNLPPIKRVLDLDITRNASNMNGNILALLTQDKRVMIIRMEMESLDEALTIDGIEDIWIIGEYQCETIYLTVNGELKTASSIFDVATDPGKHELLATGVKSIHPMFMDEYDDDIPPGASSYNPFQYARLPTHLWIRYDNVDELIVSRDSSDDYRRIKPSKNLLSKRFIMVARFEGSKRINNIVRIGFRYILTDTELIRIYREYRDIVFDRMPNKGAKDVAVFADGVHYLIDDVIHTDEPKIMTTRRRSDDDIITPEVKPIGDIVRFFDFMSGDWGLIRTDGKSYVTVGHGRIKNLNMPTIIG